jgi:hypothetical protein
MPDTARFIIEMVISKTVVAHLRNTKLMVRGIILKFLLYYMISTLVLR